MKTNLFKIKSLIVAIVILLPTFLQAQFSVQKFEPSSFGTRYITTDSSETNGHLNLFGGFMFNYASDPLIFERISKKNSITQEVINHLVAGDFLFSVSLFDRIETGIAFPVFFYIGGKTGSSVVTVDQLSSFSLGDIRLSVKGTLIKPKKTKWFGLALGADTSFPTASDNSYVGEKFIVFTPKLIVDFFFSKFAVSLNTGWRIRKNSTLMI